MLIRIQMHTRNQCVDAQNAWQCKQSEITNTSEFIPAMVSVMTVHKQVIRSFSYMLLPVLGNEYI